MSNRRDSYERTFRLLIYESEYRQIQAWTNKHQDIETGGDLYGLWADERTAVVQLVVGPGKHCRRTSTSFYQDIDYLKRTGDVLTLEEGLCHIGEWHSHHRLGLSRPSGGDESTVWRNMNRYDLSRFLLLIANISTTWSWSHLSSVPDDITVNGFLFEVDRQRQRGLPVMQAEFIFLREESPFRLRNIEVIREGAESLNSVQDHLRVVLKKCQQMELERNKVHQANQKLLQANQQLETSLAKEKHARQETEKELRNIKQQVNKLQTSLHKQTRVGDEAEKTVNSVLQKSQQLTEEARWHEQRSHELETHLGAERQAREETEKNLNYILQQSQTLKERAEWHEQRSRELEASFVKVKQAREDLKTALAEEQKAHEKTKRDLYNSERRSNEQAASLTVERPDKIGPKTGLAKVQEAHEEARRYPMTSNKLKNRTLPTTQQDFEEHSSSRDTSCDWILEHSEITLSDTVIREGKVGRVVVGGFRDRNVAVKVVHPLILPWLDQSVFEREMKMAFECRHDCLLQFIGVAFDQSPLFVTELLETNLRAVLQERPLEPSEIPTIALDVAEGLNYLHLKRPDPIVHGDISSANVLLWRKDGDWRAKVSDCVTDNFLRQSMAVSSDVNYTAPETHQISYTPKVDVYSFGVVLCEMNIRNLPADVIQRNIQIDRLHYEYSWLIKDCLREFPNTRPSMAKIIEKIKDLQDMLVLGFTKYRYV